MSALAAEVVVRAWRERILWIPLALLLALLLLDPLVASLSMGGSHRAVLDVTLGAMWLVAAGLGATVGTRHPGAELRAGTAEIYLARAISPAGFVTARGLGVAATLAVAVAGLVTAGAAAMAVYGHPVPWSALPALASCLWVEALVVAGLASLLGTLLPAPMAAAGVLGLWVAGHLLGAHGVLAAQGGPALQVVHQVLAVLVPDLGALDVHTPMVQGRPIDPARVLLGCAHGLAWVIGLGAATAFALSRRDLA